MAAVDRLRHYVRSRDVRSQRPFAISLWVRASREQAGRCRCLLALNRRSEESFVLRTTCGPGRMIIGKIKLFLTDMFHNPCASILQICDRRLVAAAPGAR